MMENEAGSQVSVIGAGDVEAALQGREEDVLSAVRQAYEAHARGASSLPHSSFLRFPDSDRDRIICLPAYLGGDDPVAGVKWIASMPGNLDRGLERASAVMVLNDRTTGRPTSVLEGSIISKQRTAASAALASKILAAEEPSVIGFVGCGPINRAVAQFLMAVWPGLSGMIAFDLAPLRAESFATDVAADNRALECRVAASLDDLLRECPMVSFATTAISPYLGNLDDCPAGATILHVSLRDLDAGVILSNHNIVDDLDHVNRAATSIHLASQKEGNTDFVHGTLGEILLGKIDLPPRDARKVIFSPFGLGVLDLAVAGLVQSRLAESGGGTVVDSFLPEPPGA